MNDATPRVSVVLTTYRRPHLLPRAIDSVLVGTYANFELLVIDDASPDDTASVVARYSDPRVRYVRMPTNGGVLRARNRGFDLATGDYVVLLDDDDELVPDALLQVVRAFAAHQSNRVEILWFDCVDAEAGSASGAIAGADGPIRYDEYVCGRIEGDFWLAFSRRALTGARFREDLKAHESLLWLRLHRQYAARHVAIIACRKYRRHGGPRLSEADARLKDLSETARALRAYLEEFGDDIRRACPRVYGFRLAYLGFHELLGGNGSEGRRLIAESLHYRPSLKYRGLLLLSHVVGPRQLEALYRRLAV